MINLWCLEKMTVQELEVYFKRHAILAFRYRSRYYSIVKGRSGFRLQYRLVTADGLRQQGRSLEELRRQAHMFNGVLLGDAIEKNEIEKPNDPSWETYDAIRHFAIVHGDEIHFLYNQRSYWIAHAGDHLYHLSDDLGNSQQFASCRDLFENARIDNMSLRDIWDNVTVDTY